MNDEVLRLANEVRNKLGDWFWCPYCGGSALRTTYHTDGCDLDDLLDAIDAMEAES